MAGLSLIVKNILIPTDGSEYSATTLEYALYLARKLKTSITGLYVIDIKLLQGPLLNDLSGFSTMAPSQEFIPFIAKGLEERAKKIQENFQERCQKENIPFTFKTQTGIIDDMIIEAGQKADWIMLAQRGENYPLTRNLLLGSTSESVVRKSGKPVIITPLSFRPIKKIGLAYDGSPPGEKALETAVLLSKAAEWPLFVIIISADHISTAGLKQKTVEILDRYGMPHNITMHEGKEEQEILKFATEHPEQLLVMGAYGHSRIREMILGSTTSYVIRNTTVPVLLTR